MSLDNWFEESREQIRWAFEDEYDLYCRLLAATSPISEIYSNVRLANKAYRQLRIDGKIGDGFLGVHRISLDKFLGNNPHTMGRKIWSLYQNLVGNEMVVPVDRWILRYFGYEPETVYLSDKLYNKIEEEIIKQAREKHISPSQRQIEIWIQSRSNGSSRGAESYGSVLKDLGIHRTNLLRRLL